MKNPSKPKSIGRAKKPTALKVLAGNPGRRPLPEHEPEFDAVDTSPPEYLQGEALKQWEQLAPAMAVNGMLNVASRNALAVYCDLMGMYIEMRQSGERPPMNWVQNIRLMAREFGFTPSSAASVVAPAKVDKKDDKERFFGT